MYDMIIEQDLSTDLGLNSEFSDHIIELADSPFEVSTTPMVDLGACEFQFF